MEARTLAEKLKATGQMQAKNYNEAEEDFKRPLRSHHIYAFKSTVCINNCKFV